MDATNYRRMELPQPVVGARYAPTWRALARRRQIRSVLRVAVGPVMGVAFAVGSPGISLFAFFLWIALAMLSAVVVRLVRCPRCASLAAFSHYLRSPKRCTQCGLSVGTLSAFEEEEQRAAEHTQSVLTGAYGPMR